MKEIDGAGIDYLSIDSWKTPATEYALQTHGRATIKRKRYNRGLYIMEGVLGYPFFAVEKPIYITSLEIDGQIWMVDDPFHWLGMRELAANSFGNVLVVGLGLGLVVHHLVAQRPKVLAIDVLERDKDVTALVWPYVSKLEGVRLIKGNFWDKEDFEKYETVILDIWTSDVHSQVQSCKQMRRAVGRVFVHGCRGNVWVWGTRDISLNPAVKLMSMKSERALNAVIEAMRSRDSIRSRGS